jgi:hypothetical protein
MFPRFREQIGTAFDLIVEFSTLGEYRLGGTQAHPGAPIAPVDAPGQAPQMGGAAERPRTGPLAGRAAVRRTVAGGAAGQMPVATPAARRSVRPACRGVRRKALAQPPARCSARSARPAAAEQLCLAV